MSTSEIKELVRAALSEDVGTGDITSAGSLEVKEVRASVVAKSRGVVSGLIPFREVFEQIDAASRVTLDLSDGASFEPGDRIVGLEGFNSSLLIAERTALNFLGHLSGIATLTSQFVAKVKGTDCRILDTRKTTPLLRSLEKAAVVHGGGMNHRMGLWDMVLIKDNHIAAAGSISLAVSNCKELLASSGRFSPRKSKADRILIEVEVTNEAQLREAIKSGVDRLLLDNQSPESLIKLVRLARELESEVELEASGNVSLETVADLAASGVDFISVGAITHSAPVSDFSMRITE